MKVDPANVGAPASLVAPAPVPVFSAPVPTMPENPFSPATLGRWRLNGEPIISAGSAVAVAPPVAAGAEEEESGGVPAAAAVEFIDWGVPAAEVPATPVEASSGLICGDFRVGAGSPMGSAEWARLSYYNSSQYTKKR